jgi:hypothetical protein
VDERILNAGLFLPALWERDMTEPVIDEVEVEEFTDELSDEALDREGALACCSCQNGCRAGN